MTDIQQPLGATIDAGGINFAVRSKGATKVELLLFMNAQDQQPHTTVPMCKTGDVWHCYVAALPENSLYLYRAHGSYNPSVDGTRFNSCLMLIDPYSKALDGVNNLPLGFDNSDSQNPDRHLKPRKTESLNEVSKSVAVGYEFDWQGDKPPGHALEDSFIYELNVRGFTAGIQELGKLRGTYRGLVQKIPHLKRLGVTAVELMPVMEFAEVDWHVNPDTGESLKNAWGYQTLAFQAPAGKYAADGTRGQQVSEFKYMVQQLHRHDIEVILDIVFNHTGENDQYGPTVCFRGLDNNVYYMLAPGAPAQYVDHTGCRNTLNVNEPGVRQLILDTLRYWTVEMHVDGFRFDLATVFNYDSDGIDRDKTPIISEIENDPVLLGIKLIAEPWSADQYKLGHFSEQRWAEWNGSFRDTVRRFVKSDSGTLRTLAKRITGSKEWFDINVGRHSINFVTAHDGFTLNDLVSYAEKHNYLNGENNNDGTNENFSWNWGVEGPVDGSDLSELEKLSVEATRERLIKNMLALLFLSQGTPMLLSGDEFRRTAKGNNNYWPQDDLNLLDWSLSNKYAGVQRFTEMMSALRRQFQLGRPHQVIWHGAQPFQQDFSDDGHLLAWQTIPFVIEPVGQRRSLYCAFNMYWQAITVKLPAGRWRRLVDTNLPSGQDIVSSAEAPAVLDDYRVEPRSGIVLESICD